MADVFDDEPPVEVRDPRLDEPKSTSPAVAVVSSEAVPGSVWDQIVGEWLHHLRSSPIAQAGGAWECLNGAMPHLKELLERDLKR